LKVTNNLKHKSSQHPPIFSYRCLMTNNDWGGEIFSTHVPKITELIWCVEWLTNNWYLLV